MSLLLFRCGNFTLDNKTFTFFRFLLVSEDLLRCRGSGAAKLKKCRVPSSSKCIKIMALLVPTHHLLCSMSKDSIFIQRKDRKIVSDEFNSGVYDVERNDALLFALPCIAVCRYKKVFQQKNTVGGGGHSTDKMIQF